MLEKTVCERDKCMGCMACIEKCPVGAVEIRDSIREYNAVIDTEKCIECDACTKVCPNIYRIERIKPKYWYQGWGKDKKQRIKSTSGGIATAIMKAFAEQKGCVCSCIFKDGNFTFDLIDKVEEINKFSGSKYVKSSPQFVYRKIKEKLLNNRLVLFVGLPCQVAGLKNFIGSNLQTNLYTIDLVCHGTPSPNLLELYLSQHGLELNNMEDVRFRVKQGVNLNKEFKTLTHMGIVDRYTFSFLKSINYTENCYSCQFARKERISDLTLGDSWGSSLPKEEQKKGISLVLCQTEKGEELLEKSNLFLTKVNIENALINNSQLNGPAKNKEKRNKFFKLIKKGVPYDKAVFCCYPKICIRQDVKELLMKLNLYQARTISEYNINYLLRSIGK